MKDKRIVGASHDGSREFITLIASICADGSSIPPALIYKGESKDLQDSWLDDFDEHAHRVFFASSKNGWSDDELGLEWLQRVFDRTTKEKVTARDRRLLIVDGHSSHINMNFIEYADANRILLAVFPPHSTHRLQPLDIGLFSPLANYYSQAIDRLLNDSQGLLRLTKRDFFPCFWDAYQKAFSAKNVRSAWEKAGLYPLQPSRVIASITNQASSSRESILPEALKTPGSTRSLRRTFRRLQEEGKVHPDALILLHAGEKFAADRDILQHENFGLRKAIIHEKKKRKRGKAMHLYDAGETAGQGRFFSPTKIARARQRIADAQAEDAQRKQVAEDVRTQKAIERSEKRREIDERKEQRQIARQIAREELAREKTERQALRKAQLTEKALEKQKRMENAAAKQAQRIAAKEKQVKQPTTRKRVNEDSEHERPPKRARQTSPRSRTAAITHSLPGGIESPSSNPLLRLVARSEEHSSVNTNKSNNDEPVPQIGRSGRAVRLPTRFR